MREHPAHRSQTDEGEQPGELCVRRVAIGCGFQLIESRLSLVGLLFLRIGFANLLGKVIRFADLPD